MVGDQLVYSNITTPLRYLLLHFIKTRFINGENKGEDLVFVVKMCFKVILGNVSAHFVMDPYIVCRRKLLSHRRADLLQVKTAALSVRNVFVYGCVVYIYIHMTRSL